jgi:S1-C subfamily serine protease
MFGPDSDGQLRVEIVGTDRIAPRSGVEAGTWEGVTTGYVVESRELAKRLEEVRERTLRIARIQLDHLVRLQGGGVEAPVASNRRVAGAEFLALTPELAEYFAGVQDGLLVLRVIPKTPASQLGLRDGDVVIETDGNPVRTIEVFRTRIYDADQQGIVVKWMRKGVEVDGRLTGP